MSDKTQRAKQYFIQVKKFYNSQKQPDIFNNELHVSIELLYSEILKLARITPDSKRYFIFRYIFNARLRKLLKDKSDFNLSYLSTKIKHKISRLKMSTYWIYFGVPIKRSSSTTLPFGKTIKLDGIVFHSISNIQFERAHPTECLEQYYRKLDENLKFHQSRSAILRDFYYFRTKVTASNIRWAADLAINAFDILYACTTVAQNSHSYRHTLFSARTRSRSILAPVGIMLVSSDKHRSCELMWSADIRTQPEEELSFTKDLNKLKYFSEYKRACNEQSPISKRLRKFLLAFANSLHTDDPQIRQLGFWRCLEIATSRKDGSRPEKEILKILSNFYRDSEIWRQQGELIKRMRNSFVHEGIVIEQDTWGSADKYLNWTQQYADKALAILRWMRDNKIGKNSPDEIDDFFDLYSKSTKTLRIANKIVRGREKSLKQC